MAAYEEARKVKEAHEKLLLLIPGVIAVGIGRRGTTENYCIKVYINEGYSNGNPIPSQIDGVDVDVIPSGPIKTY